MIPFADSPELRCACRLFAYSETTTHLHVMDYMLKTYKSRSWRLYNKHSQDEVLVQKRESYR